MSILIVGNILKDVYLNLDTRTENFEKDSHGTAWLDFSFDASEHHFFHRESSLGGAAVSLEVLQKLGLSAAISGSPLDFHDETRQDFSPASYRYVLIAESGASYLSPTTFASTSFEAPATSIDYLYIDRSASLDADAINEIQTYLQNHPTTQLILYLSSRHDSNLVSLLPNASLVFAESLNSPALESIPSSKIIYLSDTAITCENISEPFSLARVSILTHLSFYSIAAATILGCFILGYSIEDSFKLARLNLENSRLNSVLPLSQLKELMSNPDRNLDNLELIAKNLVLSPKGILAADESGGSIHKKFAQLEIPDTYENRRDYRNIFFTTKHLADYVNGVILFDETARQFSDDGQNFVDFLTARRIIPGIKVDQGLEKYADSTPENYHPGANPTETWTKGLDDLDTRLAEYYQMGLRFAKWRAAFEIHHDTTPNTPTDAAILTNCEILAKYAKTCQNHNIVPIVEPELIYDGDYDIAESAKTTSRILDQLFDSLEKEQVNLRACILKTNMVLAGKKQEHQSTPEEVGQATAEVLERHVPDDLAGVVFLSGGQTVEQATENLAAVIKNGPFPWPVTFSFARALQDPALYAWAGHNENADAARQAFLDRLVANTDALKNH